MPEESIWRGSWRSDYTPVTLSKCNGSSISSILRLNIQDMDDFSWFTSPFSFVFFLIAGDSV